MAHLRNAHDTWFRAAPVFQGEKLKVDREKGVIYGVSVVTEGEASGHGVWLDSEFAGNVATMGNEFENGVKSRFGHPAMSGTALGTFLARAKNFTSEKDENGNAVTRADLHLSESAKKSPNGDLYSYVLDLAEEDPESLGLSIAFTRGKSYTKNEKGEKKFTDNPEKGQKLYASIKELRAVDMVDEPAANPKGLFSSDMPAARVSEFLDANPDIYQLACDNTEIVTGFMARYAELLKRRDPSAQVTFNIQTSDTHTQPKETLSMDEKEIQAMQEKVKNLETENAKLSEAAKQAPEKVKEFQAFADAHGLEFAKANFGKPANEIMSALAVKHNAEIGEMKKQVDALKAKKDASGAPHANFEAEPDAKSVNLSADNSKMLSNLGITDPAEQQKIAAMKIVDGEMKLKPEEGV